MMLSERCSWRVGRQGTEWRGKAGERLSGHAGHHMSGGAGTAIVQHSAVPCFTTLSPDRGCERRYRTSGHADMDQRLY